MSTENEKQLAEIKDDRDYAIRKGRVFEQFEQNFHTRYRDNALYAQVREALIYGKDPYLVIQMLITINDEAYQKVRELAELIPVQPTKIKP